MTHHSRALNLEGLLSSFFAYCGHKIRCTFYLDTCHLSTCGIALVEAVVPSKNSNHVDAAGRIGRSRSLIKKDLLQTTTGADYLLESAADG